MTSRRYQRIRVVGSGSYGCCYLVTYKGKQFIEKSIDLSQMAEGDREETKTEIRVLQSLRHPYIIAYRDSYIKSHELSIVMDYADGGDLHGAIKKNRRTPFADTKVLKWFTQMCLAMKHIHDKKILHRDLKTQNIFLQKSDHDPDAIKIGDFGIARVLSHTQEFAHTRIGTPYYLSPEICMEKPYGFKTDVWSLGCVLYQLVTFKHPFNASSIRELCNRIMFADYAKLDANVSALHRELIADALQKDPRKRPSCEQLLQKPALQKQILKFHISDAEKERIAKSAHPAPDGDCLPVGQPAPSVPTQEHSHAMRHLEERRSQHKEQISDDRKHKEAHTKSTYDALAAQEFFVNRALANRAREKVQAEEERSKNADIDEAADRSRLEIDAQRHKAMEQLRKQREELERGKRKLHEEMERESQRKSDNYAIRASGSSNAPHNETQGALRAEDRVSMSSREAKEMVRAVDLDMERALLNEARLKKEQRRQSRMAYSAGLRGFIDAQRKKRKHEMEHNGQENVLVVNKSANFPPPKKNAERFEAAEAQRSSNSGKEAVGTEGWCQPPLSARYRSTEREDDASGARVPHTARGERDACWTSGWTKPSASNSGERILFNKAPSAWLPPERDTAHCDVMKDTGGAAPVPSGGWEPPSAKWTPALEIMDKPTTRTVFACNLRAQAHVSQEEARSNVSSGGSNSDGSDKDHGMRAPRLSAKETASRAESKSPPSVSIGKKTLSPTAAKDQHVGPRDVWRASTETSLQTHDHETDQPLSPPSAKETDVGSGDARSASKRASLQTHVHGSEKPLSPVSAKEKDVGSRDVRRARNATAVLTHDRATDKPLSPHFPLRTDAVSRTSGSPHVVPSSAGSPDITTATAGTSTAPCTAENRHGAPTFAGVPPRTTVPADTREAPCVRALSRHSPQEKGAAVLFTSRVDDSSVPIGSSVHTRGTALVALNSGARKDSVPSTSSLDAHAVVPRASQHQRSIASTEAPSRLSSVENTTPAARASGGSRTTTVTAAPIPQSVEVGQRPSHNARTASQHARSLTIDTTSPTVLQTHPVTSRVPGVERTNPTRVADDLESCTPMTISPPRTNVILNHTNDVHTNDTAGASKLDVSTQNSVSSTGYVHHAEPEQNKPTSINSTPRTTSSSYTNDFNTKPSFNPPRRNASVDNWNRRKTYHNNAPAASAHNDIYCFGRNQTQANHNTPPPMSARGDRPIFVTVDPPLTARYGYERSLGDEWHSCPHAESSQRLIQKSTSVHQAARWSMYNTREQRPVVSAGGDTDEDDDDVLRDFLQQRRHSRVLCGETATRNGNTSARPLVPRMTTESWQSPVAPVKHGLRVDDDASEKKGFEWRSHIPKPPKEMQIRKPINTVTNSDIPTLKTMQMENPIDPITNMELRLFDARRDSASFRIEQLRAHLEKQLGLTEFINAYRYLQDEDGNKGSWQNANLKPYTEKYLPLIHQLLRYEDEYYSS